MALALHDAVVLARSFFDIQNWVSCVGCESGNASSAEAGPTCESGNASSAQAGPTYFNSSGVVQRGIDHFGSRALSKAASTSPSSDWAAPGSAFGGAPVESRLPPISMPAELPVTPHAPEDSRSDRAPPPRLEAPAMVSDDSASAPSVKRQRQPPASATCAHSQSLAPPFHPDACGHHLGDKSRRIAFWGKKGHKLLPNSY